MLRFVLLLGLLSAFAPLAIDMYLPALPAIGAEFGRGVAGAQVTLAVFLAGMAVGQLLHGPLSDRFGRRPPLFAGLGAFVIASAACALAFSLEALAAARFLQAFAGCAGMVIARAVVRDLADRLDPVRLVARLMLVMGVAPILAPLAGGYVHAILGWRAIFWFLAAVGLLALALCWRLLPETLPPGQRRTDGVAGALRGYGALLRDRRFLRAALPGGLAIAGMFSFIAGSPFVFIGVHGIAPERFGLFFGAGAAAVILGTQLAGRLADRWGRERLFTRALGALAMAALLLAGASVAGLPLAGVYVPVILFMGAMGLVLPMAGVLAVLPFPERAGAASALMGAAQFTFGSLAGAAVTLGHDGTGVPMAGVMAAATGTAFGLRWALARLG